MSDNTIRLVQITALLGRTEGEKTFCGWYRFQPLNFHETKHHVLRNYLQEKDPLGLSFNLCQVGKRGKSQSSNSRRVVDTNKTIFNSFSICKAALADWLDDSIIPIIANLSSVTSVHSMKLAQPFQYINLVNLNTNTRRINVVLCRK